MCMALLIRRDYQFDDLLDLVLKVVRLLKSKEQQFIFFFHPVHYVQDGEATWSAFLTTYFYYLSLPPMLTRVQYADRVYGCVTKPLSSTRGSVVWLELRRRRRRRSCLGWPRFLPETAAHKVGGRRRKLTGVVTDEKRRGPDDEKRCVDVAEGGGGGREAGRLRRRARGVERERGGDTW